MRPVNEELLCDVCGLNKNAPLLVGVSGGPDSVFLWRRFLELGFPVVVAHFDHGLRPDSRADAEWVSEQQNISTAASCWGKMMSRHMLNKRGFHLKPRPDKCGIAFSSRQRRQMRVRRWLLDTLPTIRLKPSCYTFYEGVG